jgi:hypothetical protein
MLVFALLGLQVSAGKLPPCDDRALQRYSLAVAFGPDPGVKAPDPPRCVPSDSQGLFWDELDKLDVRHLSLSKISNQTVVSKEPPHFVHLRVVQSFPDWCEYPCDTPTWELAADKSEPGSPYVLYEAAIWHQLRKVTLYRFDPEWLARAKQTYNNVCHGAWNCPMYEAFREKRRVLSFGPWLMSKEKDRDYISGFVRRSFAAFFAEIQKDGAKHVALTYSGHGHQGDGSLFEGCVRKEDSDILLHHITGLGPKALPNGDSLSAVAGPPDEGPSLKMGRLAMLNWGTNCEEGKANMLFAHHPFADWVLASDLKVGGIEPTDDEAQGMAEAKRALDAPAILKQVMHARGSVREAVEKILQGREKLWATAWKPPIVRQRLPQTLAAFEATFVPDFHHGLQNAYRGLAPQARQGFVQHVERHHCDVLEAAKYLDGGALLQSNRSFLQSRMSTGDLQGRFMLMRPFFVKTEYAQVNGLGFKFLGWDGPPCDLKSVLGKDAEAPPGGWGENVW